MATMTRYDHQLIYLFKVDGSDASLEPITTPTQRYVAVVTVRTDLDAFANDDYVRLIVDGAYVDILPLSDLADMISVVGVSVTFRIVLASQPRELKTKAFGDASADVRLWRLDGVPEISVRGSDIRQHVAGKVATNPLSLFYRSDEGKCGTLFWCKVGAREERKDASLPLSSITGLLVGKQHAAFINKRLAPDERCFSIIAEHTQLHVECASVRERKDWLSALKNDLATCGIVANEAPSLVVRHTPGVNHVRPPLPPGQTVTRVLSPSEVEAEQIREKKWHTIVDRVQDTPAVWRQQALGGGRSTNVTLGFNKDTCAIYWLLKGTTIQTQDKSGSLLSLTEIYKGKQVGAHVSADASGRITKDPTPGTDDQSLSLVFTEPAPGTSLHHDGATRRMVTRTIDLIVNDVTTRDAFINAIREVLLIKGKDVVEQAKYVYRTYDAAMAATAANDAADAQAEVEAINAANTLANGTTHNDDNGNGETKESKAKDIAIPGLVMSSLPLYDTCVSLSLSATNLVQMDVMTPSDPLVAIVVKDKAGNFTQQIATTEWILDACNPTWTRVPQLPYDAKNTALDVRISVYDADDDGIVETSDRLIGSFDTTMTSLIAAAHTNTSIIGELTNSNAKIQRLLAARKSSVTIRPSLTTANNNSSSVAVNGASSPSSSSSSASRVVKHKEESLDTTFVVFYREGEFESSAAYQSSMTFFCEDQTLYWSPLGTRTKSYGNGNSSNGNGIVNGYLQAGSVPLTSIIGVLVGKQKSLFDQAGQPGVAISHDGRGVRRAIEEHSFTLLTTTRQLDLEAKSSEQRSLWLSSLQSTLAKVGRDVQFVSRLHITEELEGVGQELEFEGWPYHEQDNIGERLAITIGCRDLPKADETSESDPVVAAFERDPATGRQRLIGYTEWVKDDPSPNFARQIVLYNPTSKDPLRAASAKEIVFNVYDVDRAVVSEHDLLGHAVFSVAELLASPGERLSHPLHHTDAELDTKMEELNSRIVVTPSFTDAPLIHDPVKALRASVMVYAPVLTDAMPLDVWYVDDGTNRGGSLYWGSAKDARNASAQHLRDVTQVSIGRQTPAFNKQITDGGDRSLSIRVKSNPHGSLLDLEFVDARSRNVFLEALEQVILRSTPDDVHVVHENRITFGDASTVSLPTLDVSSPSSSSAAAATSNGTISYGTGIKPGRFILTESKRGTDSVPPSPLSSSASTPNGHGHGHGTVMRFGPVTPTPSIVTSSSIAIAPRSLVGGHHRTHSVPVKFTAPLTPPNGNGNGNGMIAISPASSPFRFGARVTSPSDSKSNGDGSNGSGAGNGNGVTSFEESRDELFAEAARYHSNTGSDFIIIVRQPGTDRIITLCSDKFHDHKDRMTEAVAAASAVLRA